MKKTDEFKHEMNQKFTVLIFNMAMVNFGKIHKNLEQLTKTFQNLKHRLNKHMEPSKRYHTDIIEIKNSIIEFILWTND